MYRLLRHKDASLKFSLDSDTDRQNRFTVVLGPNGTGKSQLLRSIAEMQRASISKNGQRHIDPLADEQPKSDMSRLLVLSNMVTDVFVNTSKRRDVYRYLGLRQASNNTSTGALRDVTTASILECSRIPEGMARLRPVIQALGGSDVRVGFERSRTRVASRATSSELSIVGRFLDNLESNYERSHYSPPAALLEELRNFDELISSSTNLLALDASEMDHLWDMSARFQVDAFDLTSLLRRLRYSTVSIHVELKHGFVSLDELSTGQLLLLSTFARVAANVDPNSLVIIDEPEAGLHPNWQSEWIPLMRATIPAHYGCHLFIATHSPYLVSDADDVLIPGKEWGTFIQFNEPHQGRSIENILYRVFNARVSGNLMVEDDLRTLIKFVSRSPQRVGPDRLEKPVESGQLKKAKGALDRLRRMQGRDTENLNLIIAQASEVIDR